MRQEMIKCGLTLGEDCKLDFQVRGAKKGHLCLLAESPHFLGKRNKPVLGICLYAHNFKTLDLIKYKHKIKEYVYLVAKEKSKTIKEESTTININVNIRFS